jgi:hypothetical protein
MPLNTFDLITQAQLKVGADLTENMSVAARICKLYMQELQQRVALGEMIEPGTLTFNSQTMCVSRTVC